MHLELNQNTNLFLDLIFAKDYLNDNELKLLTMKDILETLNIK